MDDLKEVVMKAIQDEWARRSTPNGPQVLDSEIFWKRLAGKEVEVPEEEKARILEELHNEDRLHLTPIHGEEGWLISAPGRVVIRAR